MCVCVYVICHTQCICGCVLPMHSVCPPETRLTAEVQIPTYLFEVATADIVVCQGAPQLAQLVSEAGEPTTDYGIHIERLYLVWILGDKVTQLVPELQDTGCWANISVLVHEGRHLSPGLHIPGNPPGSWIYQPWIQSAHHSPQWPGVVQPRLAGHWI